MSNAIISKNKIEEYIEHTLDNLYTNEEYLINHSPSVSADNTDEKRALYYVSERGIVCWFAHYLRTNIAGDKLLEGYKVDTEYNRLFHYTKCFREDILEKYEITSKCIIPDLIIHKRGEKDNLLVLEFKCWWQLENETIDELLSKDNRRIRAFIEDEQFSYKYGSAIFIGKTRKDCKWELKEF